MAAAIDERILDYLADDPDVWLTASEVPTASGQSRSDVRRALHRLAGEDRIERSTQLIDDESGSPVAVNVFRYKRGPAPRTSVDVPSQPEEPGPDPDASPAVTQKPPAKPRAKKKPKPKADGPDAFDWLIGQLPETEGPCPSCSGSGVGLVPVTRRQIVTRFSLPAESHLAKRSVDRLTLNALESMRELAGVDTLDEAAELWREFIRRGKEGP